MNMAINTTLPYNTNQTANPSANRAAANDRLAGKTAVSDTVTLSPEAQTALATGRTAPINDFNQYFPTREGFTSTALSDAVTDPGKQTSSAGKDIDATAQDARARMDAKYAAMAAGGKPYDVNSNEGVDVAALMGDLDRRSLYAVSSNVGGLFSKEEQDMASMFMTNQQGLAMGLYAGPTRLEGDFAARHGMPLALTSDYAKTFKAGVAFLDQVSNDEKSSISWAMSRAAAQNMYESGMRMMGKTPENLDSENPLVKLIQAAIATMRNDPARGMTHGLIANADQLKSQPWFKGFESQLDGAIQATQRLLLPGQ